jgi:hypothetical protein
VRERKTERKKQNWTDKIKMKDISLQRLFVLLLLTKVKIKKKSPFSHFLTSDNGVKIFLTIKNELRSSLFSVSVLPSLLVKLFF